MKLQEARGYLRSGGLCVLIYLCPVKVWAGAWPMPKGAGQIITTTVYDTAKRGFDGEGRNSQDVSFSKVETSFFAEYGLTDRVTLVGITALQEVDYLAASGRERFNGFGDTELGVRYNLYSDGKTVLSLQPSFVFAGGGENIPDADLGGGENSLELRGLFGRNGFIGSRAYFVDVQAAHRMRFGDDPAGWRIDVTAGLRTSQKTQVFVQGFFSENNERLQSQDIILPTESLKAQFSCLYHVDSKTSYQIGAFQTLQGKNIVKERAVTLGVWYRF